jgi:hypothetical protein
MTRIHTAHDWQKEIARRVGRPIRHLQIKVKEQGLILRGEVPNYYTKQLVQTAAMELGGTVLANEVVVS